LLPPLIPSLPELLLCCKLQLLVFASRHVAIVPQSRAVIVGNIMNSVEKGIWRRKVPLLLPTTTAFTSFVRHC
jgi:hypothetical protein